LIIKQRVGNSWKELYPKTLAENVKLKDGRTLQQYKEEVDSRFPDQIPLWEGNVYPLSEDTITPSKRLSECANGWLLRWQRRTASGLENNNYQYTYIPKIHLLSSNGGVRVVLGSTGGTYVFKYIYVDANKITGHATNEQDNNHNIALSGVFEY
jgi:hypothetical protein